MKCVHTMCIRSMDLGHAQILHLCLCMNTAIHQIFQHLYFWTHFTTGFDNSIKYIHRYLPSSTLFTLILC